VVESHARSILCLSTMMVDVPSTPNQFSLRTLLLAVGFVAILCSIGVCTRWLVPVGIGLAMAVGGIAGKLIAKTRRGSVRGAVWGLRLSFVAMAGITGHLFYTGWCVEPRPMTQPYDATHRQPVAQLLSAVRAIVPSVQGIPNDSRLKELLAGCYEDDLTGLSGDTLYLFPDGTYLCTEWADILPMEICDRGLWECQDGLLALHSDGDLQATFTGSFDAVYLPLSAVADANVFFEGATVGKSYLLLLGVDRGLGFFQDAAKEKESSLSKTSSLFICCRHKTKAVAMGEIAAINRDLYGRYPPKFDRSAWRDKLLRHGMALGLLASVLAVTHIVASRRRRNAGRTESVSDSPIGARDTDGSLFQEMPH
jgi:hypothetical protein